MSLLEYEVFRANIGVLDMNYTIAFLNSDEFETRECDPFPTPRRVRDGMYSIEDDGKTLELRYDPIDDEQQGPVVRVAFCIVDHTTNHVIDRNKMLTTHKTLVCNASLLPHSDKVLPMFRSFRCPLVWYALPKD